MEELEDEETCTTEVFLNDDNTVDVGETDGPIYTKASGTWEQPAYGSPSPTSFKMVLTRTYEAGKEPTGSTDIGTFEFTVKRSFTGEQSMVGESMAVVGTMHHLMDGGAIDQEVGYFNMIDTTKERLGEKE